jgi:hypothetical protein
MSCGLQDQALPAGGPELCKLMLVRVLVRRTQSLLFGVLLALYLITSWSGSEPFHD